LPGEKRTRNCKNGHPGFAGLKKGPPRKNRTGKTTTREGGEKEGKGCPANDKRCRGCSAIGGKEKSEKLVRRGSRGAQTDIKKTGTAQKEAF